MYEKIEKNPRVKSDRVLRNMVLACVLVLALAAVMLIRAAGYFSRYQEFVGKLSDSTVYAYDNRCLRAEVEGQSLWVNLKNDYGLYTHITVYGVGVEKHSTPKRAADVELYYGNGSSLKLWDMEASGSAGAHSLFLHYEDETGYSYSYVSGEVDLETLKNKYLLVKTNRAWEE